MKTIKNSCLNEQYVYFKHKSGLPVFIYPKEGYEGTYAIFGTNYGSVDESFKKSDENEYTTVPSGIAHFLEHKLFESEKGDAFSRYAKTGASANAYTSFDKTCYLFTCSENVEESLEILLDFVTSPFFTKETVEKEQEIIGQEIRMYDDSAEWQVFFNLLRALYVNHPIKLDIAGTVETIAQIDADVLYKCYNTFYNLSNMALCVVGNIMPETVEKIADKILKNNETVTIDRKFIPEPSEISQKRIQKEMAVAMPLFQMGYKLLPCGEYLSQKQKTAAKVLLEMLVGDASELYRSLLDKELINAEFGSELLEGRGFASVVMGGESKDPDKVYEIINKKICEYKNAQIDTLSFERAKKTVYGRMISSFNSIERIGGEMIEAHFGGATVFGAIEAAVSITMQDIKVFAEQLSEQSGALSVILPKR